MSHTFDVRFAPSAGLAAILAAPINTLRWKGAGRLSIQHGAVTIALKRGLFKRSRRIAADQLREVYREGEALRLEFSGPGNAREVLPLWADNRETAAEIVRLLPTTRTVEVEQAAHKPPPKFRPDVPAIGVLVAAALAIAAVVIGLQRSRELPVAAAPQATPAVTELDAGPVESGIPSEIAPVDIQPVVPVGSIDEPVVPIRPGSDSYVYAQAQVVVFEKEYVALLEEYRLYRSMLEEGALTSEGYIAKLEGPLEGGWWAITFRILEDPKFDDPQLVGLRATHLAAARYWRAFLDLYIEGKHQDDQGLISRSFSMLAKAEAMQQRARRYVPAAPIQ